MMRSNSLSNSMGLILILSALAACGGDSEPETASEAPMPGDDTPAMTETPAPEGPSAGPAAAPAGGSSTLIAAGQQVFVGQGLCFTCHGQEAQGTPLAPSLSDDVWLWVEDPGTDLVGKVTTVIREGVAQPKEHPAPMPPMGGAQLNDDQLNSVAAYVASLSS